MRVVKAFVDTNVLLRAFLKEMDGHTRSQTLVLTMLRERTELWVSGQIIREFIVQATHPKTLAIPLALEEVLTEVDGIKRLLQIADDTAEVRAKLIELLKTYPTRGKQVHDANIVATMLVYGVDTLLTLNVDDFRRFADQIKIISPNTQTQ